MATIPRNFPQADWLALADAIEAVELKTDQSSESTVTELEVPWEGYTLKLLVESDEDYPLADVCGEGCCYGQLETTRNNGCGPVRPASFDGRARILERDRFQATWWQPLVDPMWTKGQGDGVIGAEWKEIQRLYREGFLQVGLELLAPPCECCGSDGWGPHQRATISAQWLGGIDSLDNGYLADVAGDLLNELAHDVRRLATAERAA